MYLPRHFQDDRVDVIVEWLRVFVTRLTETQERALPDPWQVTDAPESFVERMLRGIVGIRIRIRRLEVTPAS